MVQTAEEMAAIAARAEARAAERAKQANGAAAEEARRMAEVAARAEKRAEERARAKELELMVAAKTAAAGAVAKPTFLTKAQREQKRLEQAQAKSKVAEPPKTIAREEKKKTKVEKRGGQVDKQDNEGEEMLDPKTLQRIKEQYIKTKRAPKELEKKKSSSNTRFRRMKWNFDWDEKEDTSADLDLVAAVRVRGRERSLDDLGKYDRRAGKKRALHQHWSKKDPSDRTERDWRIVREEFDIYVKGKRIPPPGCTWDEMSLPSIVRESIRRAGYHKPSAIQMQAIPVGLTQRDLIGVAETGSGKTAAFTIPLLVFLSRQSQARLDSCGEDGPLAVIMGPTRELVQQIGDEMRKLSEGTSYRTVVVVGGNSVQEQIQQMRLGCHAIAATPGRLLDCLENRYVVFNQCSYLVLDEADRMIDMGFEPQVESVLSNMSATQKADTEEEVARQEELALKGENNVRLTIMFSATMPPEVEALAAKYMRFPAIVRVGDKDTGKNKRITQKTYLLSSEAQKKRKLLELLRETRPPIIVFANSKRGCDLVLRQLLDADWRATAMHSGKQQSSREASLAGFKSGRYEVLVATDVAGRGLDISDVAHVINFEMASDIQRYTHRIGRTGRAGKSGLASTLLTEDDADMFRDLVQYLKSTNSSIPTNLLKHPKALKVEEIQS